MKKSVYIVMAKDGFRKATKGKSSLARDEIGVMVNLTIADSAFRSPTVTADIVVPDEAIDHPDVQIEAVAS